MPFVRNTFRRLQNWVRDRDANIPITASRFDAENDDFARAINSIINGAVAFTGWLRGANGTSSAPGHSFSADQDTGMYRPSPDKLGFSTGGKEAMSIDDKQKVTVQKELAVGNNKVWHAGNDGSGSGLDADTVGGAHAHELRDVTTHTGIIPPVRLLGLYSINIRGSANSAFKLYDANTYQYHGGEDFAKKSDIPSALTDAQMLNKLKRVDGTGSGLDADTLDGFHSNAFLVRTGTAANSRALGGVSAQSYARKSDLTPIQNDITGPAILNKLKRVDGTGSGLDADLLDGKHASEFALKRDIPTSLDVNEYETPWTGVDYSDPKKPKIDLRLAIPLPNASVLVRRAGLVFRPTRDVYRDNNPAAGVIRRHQVLPGSEFITQPQGLSTPAKYRGPLRTSTTTIPELISYVRSLIGGSQAQGIYASPNDYLGFDDQVDLSPYSIQHSSIRPAHRITQPKTYTFQFRHLIPVDSRNPRGWFHVRRSVGDHDWVKAEFWEFKLWAVTW